MAPLVGAHAPVPCLDGSERPYRDLDCAASTPALDVGGRPGPSLPPVVLERAPGGRLQVAPRPPRPTRRPGAACTASPGARRARDDVVVLVRNTTEAINHLAYRLRLGPDDVVVTTVVEHHANLLPWAPRGASLRWVECGPDGTFDVDDVVRVLDDGPTPALLALTGASNVTGWLPPVEEICAAAHERGVPVAPRRGAAGAPPAAAGGARLRRLQRAQALRAVRRRGADRAAARPSRPGDPSWPAAAPSTSSTSTRSSGPNRPSARRRGRPTWSAPWRSGPPGRARRASAGTRVRGARGRALGPPLRGAAGPSTASTSSGRAARGRRTAAGGGHLHRGRHAPRPGGGAPQRRVRDRGAPRVLLRAPLPAPPARRRPRRGRPRPGPPCSGANAVPSPARCGPAAASAPRATTSTRCSTALDGAGRRARRRRCATSRTRDRRLLAGGRRQRLARRRPASRRGVRAGLSARRDAAAAPPGWAPGLRALPARRARGAAPAWPSCSSPVGQRVGPATSPGSPRAPRSRCRAGRDAGRPGARTASGRR